jgi:hypothetical protein
MCASEGDKQVDVDAVAAPLGNNVFYSGDAITFNITGPRKAPYLPFPPSLTTKWEVRNYTGGLVAQGTLTPPPPPVAPAKGKPVPGAPPSILTIPQKLSHGWFKLTLKGNTNRSTVNETWIGDVTGGTTFVIFRDDPRFPKAPPTCVATPTNHDGPGGPCNLSTADPGNDAVARGVTGMGPTRHSAGQFLPRQCFANNCACGNSAQGGCDQGGPHWNNCSLPQYCALAKPKPNPCNCSCCNSGDTNNMKSGQYLFDVEAIEASLDNDLRLAEEFYTSAKYQDPERPRELLLAFSNGIPTKNPYGPSLSVFCQTLSTPSL